MDYAVQITTAHTVYTAAAPMRTVVKLSRGRLTGGWIYFPSGPAGLLHLKLLRVTHQFAPFDPQQDYSLDDVIAPLSLGFDLDQPPFQVTIATWNDSTTYDHTLTISLTLDPYFGKPLKRTFLTSLFRNSIFNPKPEKPEPPGQPKGPAAPSAR